VFTVCLLGITYLAYIFFQFLYALVLKNRYISAEDSALNKINSYFLSSHTKDVPNYTFLGFSRNRYLRILFMASVIAIIIYLLVKVVKVQNRLDGRQLAERDPVLSSQFFAIPANLLNTSSSSVQVPLDFSSLPSNAWYIVTVTPTNAFINLVNYVTSTQKSLSTIIHFDSNRNIKGGSDLIIDSNNSISISPLPVIPENILIDWRTNATTREAFSVSVYRT